jgi:hypothetical protein
MTLVYLSQLQIIGEWDGGVGESCPTQKKKKKQTKA